jgi:hypothetical protein
MDSDNFTTTYKKVATTSGANIVLLKSKWPCARGKIALGEIGNSLTMRR